MKERKNKNRKEEKECKPRDNSLSRHVITHSHYVKRRQNHGRKEQQNHTTEVLFTDRVEELYFTVHQSHPLNIGVRLGSGFGST